jgi:hypothetical protein
MPKYNTLAYIMRSSLLRLNKSMSAPDLAYIVTSYDFGGTGTVKVHIVTDDLGMAETVYGSVLEECNVENAKVNNTACKMLVELTHVPKNKPHLGGDSLTLYWGSSTATCNNNH